MKRIFHGFVGLAAAGQLALGAIVSAPNNPGLSAGGNSYNLAFSPSGRHLVFVSHANNLVTNDDLGVWLDLFVRDLTTSNTVLVSVNTNGVGGANADANLPSISSNGQVVAFASRASNLAPGITNHNVSQIFVRDLVAGTTRVASASTNGNPALQGADSPALSADGRWLAFESFSYDLVPVGNDYSLDVFVRDLLRNSNVLVSVTSAGIGADALKNEKSYSPSITSDGRHVAFLSTVLNLPTGLIRPVSSAGDVYVRDLQLGRTTWVSTNVPTIVSNAGYRCSSTVLSDDGRYAAFVVTLLDTLSSYVLRHDLQTASTLVLSSTATNVNHGIQISSDGSRVLFEESVDGVRKVRLWDAATGTNLNIACDQDGDARNASMTPDGASVVFVACSNIYVFNVASGGSVLVSVGTNGVPLSKGFDLTHPFISPDGGLVSFDHRANDFVAGDLNGASDVFLRNLSAGATELITAAVPLMPSFAASAHSFLGPNSVSRDGRFIVTTRYDDPSFFRDTNGVRDVYIHDTATGRSHALTIDTNLYTFEVGGPAFYVENTNTYSSAVISGDGSTVAAVRGAFSDFTALSRQDVVWTSSSNGVYGVGMFTANRSDVNGGTGNGSSFAPSLSSNGHNLVFTTLANDLVAGAPDNNGVSDVVLRRRYLVSNGLWSASNYLVSISLSGTAGNAVSSNGVISPDGRWVVFQSSAQDLIAPAPGGVLNLFARDVWSNATHLIAVSRSPVSLRPFITENSRYVPFVYGSGIDPSVESYYVHDLLLPTPPASNLNHLSDQTATVTSDGRLVARVFRGTGPTQVIVKDLLKNEIESIASSPAIWGSTVISKDGRYLVFAGSAYGDALVTNDTNRSGDVFVRDRLLGVTMAVSVNRQGRIGNSSSTRPVLAADGRTVVFQSFATDLAAGSYSDMRNIFLLKLGSPDTDGDGMDDDWEVTYFGNLSRNGAGDFDGDGASDYNEFVSGTDPTNSNSVFRVLTVTPVTGGSKVLFWTGNPARGYRAEFKDDLAASDWSAVTGTVTWTGSTASITDSSASGATNRYYRVVRLP